ncbi:MAG TPA: protein kinase [Gemmataceae bacterium]|jgi:WD40 repeat protein/tRNA A-37 threonylcarbamoyl transferase component Bud32
MSVNERLADLLLRWEELKEQGRPVSPEELCRDCPELLDELRRRLQTLQCLDPALAATSSSPTGTEATGIAPTIVDDSGSALRRAQAVPGYEILGELGRGGMGVVYKARQKNLDRLVALKMILAGAHAGQRQRERFRGEAEAAAQLQHPNIVQVYEIGEHERCPYISLEYIDGRGLHDVLCKGPMPPLEAAALVEQLAHAVQYAHQRGIVHRDLKPSNILLTQEGTPKITDFGLAKRLEGGTSNTRTGDIVGTPSYMAPEQASGESREIGPGTDIYSLGVILYEMLTGKPPFEGTSAFDTVYMVITSEPERLSRRNPSVPLDLETICLKCLEKDPAKRYASARALAEELRRFQRGEPIEARPVGWLERGVKWVRRRPAVSALLALLLVSLLSLLIGGWVAAINLYQGNEALKAEKRKHADLVLFSGTHFLQEGDLFASLVWFARALNLETDEARIEAHRLRLAAVLRDCPRLSQMWFHSDNVTDVTFSSDGRWVLTASSDRTARVWDAISGKARFDPPLQHNSAIYCASFSPDCSRIVTASADETARIWDAATGRSIITLEGHRDEVRDAHFSPDGKQVVTGSDDKTARLWDASTGKLLHAPLKHDGAVIHASFHPDSKRVLTASTDGSARIWQIGSDSVKEVARMRHDAGLTHASFDRAGKLVATASEDGTARVWDSVNGEPITAPLRHYGPVQFVCFRPDGQQLATSCAAHKAWVWDTRTGLTLLPPLLHNSNVSCVVFSPDGTRLLTASDDNTARVWDSANGRPLTPPIQHNGTVFRCSFSPDGRRIATADKDTTARVYDLVPQRPPQPPLEHGKPLWQATFDPKGDRVLTANTDTARIWDAKTGKSLIVLGGHKGSVFQANYSDDGSRIVTASADATARVWDAATGDAITTLSGHAGPVLTALFSPEGRRVLTASADATARIWDAATGQTLLILGNRESQHRREILDAVFSPDGRRVATASGDETARIWDAKNGDPIGKILQHQRRVVRVAFSPDGRRLATASFDQTAQIWNAETGAALLDAPLLHPGPVRDVSFSPDGLVLLTACEDNTARFWNVESGEPLLQPLQHNGSVTMARRSRDGKWIVTASDDNSGRVWDAATGEPLTPALKHRGWGRITYATFNPACDRVVTASEDGTAQICELDSKDLPKGDLEPLAELLGGNRIGANAGSRVPLAARELQRLWNERRE